MQNKVVFFLFLMIFYDTSGSQNGSICQLAWALITERWAIKARSLKLEARRKICKFASGGEGISGTSIKHRIAKTYEIINT